MTIAAAGAASAPNTARSNGHLTPTARREDRANADGANLHDAKAPSSKDEYSENVIAYVLDMLLLGVFDRASPR